MTTAAAAAVDAARRVCHVRFRVPAVSFPALHQSFHLCLSSCWTRLRHWSGTGSLTWSASFPLLQDVLWGEHAHARVQNHSHTTSSSNVFYDMELPPPALEFVPVQFSLTLRCARRRYCSSPVLNCVPARSRRALVALFVRPGFVNDACTPFLVPPGCADNGIIV